jgi:hypothetical protein
MTVPPDAIRAIEAYLRGVPHKILKRAHGYCSRGDVADLELNAQGQFTALVCGGEDHAVVFGFNKGEWVTGCSCTLGQDCRHVVAVMLELQRRREPSSPFPASQRPKSAVPQPPRSPVYDRLAEALGRSLNAEEAGYVRRVQMLYEQSDYRPLTLNDLGSLAPGLPQGWKPLELWSSHPADDFVFWLYLAWEIRRQERTPPEYMEGITDFSLIEPEIAAFEQAKEVARWSDWFKGYHDRPGAPECMPLDLRLALLDKEARLQWRDARDTGFVEMKQTHAKRFAEQFNRGSLEISAESLAMWGATYRPWTYENWWAFRYQDATAHPTLNRLLRLPLSPDRFVTADGQPLPRVAGPLRLKLSPPMSGGNHYRLALETADGSLAPPILCTLSGHPTLYLTGKGLFTGPSADALDDECSRDIPAVALESADGVRFLHSSGLPIPEHLAARIRRIPLKVAVACKLARTSPGSETEEVRITVTAKAPGLATETFTQRGWEQLRGPVVGAKPAASTARIVVYERGPQRHFPRLIEALGAKPAFYSECWTFRFTRKSVEQFGAWLHSLPPDIEVALDSELATLRDEPVSGTVSLDVQETAMDWFDLKVVLNVNDTKLTPAELKLLLAARGGYVRLLNKGWRRLKFDLSPDEDAQLARLGLDAREFDGEAHRFHALQLADDAAKRFLGAEQVEKIQRRVGELKTRVAPALPSCIRAELRPYQTEGFHFLAYLTSNRFGGVLADDMGLGKTVQTLTWLAWLRVVPDSVPPGGPACALVVCPKSVVDNWVSEAGRFFPDLRVRRWRGEASTELPAARENADLIVVNYAQLRSLSPAIASAPWLAAILDEAQYIKNPDSQTAQAARSLNAGHRLALTGTPIENRLLDLWSIMSFSMPGALGNRAHFLKKFNAQDDPLARRRLAARVRPFLLRRTKGQVAKDLPDRIEEDLLCEMEGEQQTLYRAELKRARQIILGLESSRQLNEERFNILTSLLRLRQICCHPGLLDEKFRSAESAKVAALEDVLEPLMAEGHKVLVFSQFVTMLDLLRDFVKERGWKEFYLAGDTENRGELVQEFQSAEGAAIFLISLKAGGFGLNLTAASYVVLFDPWWNPAVERQAIDRTHRIGQTSKVIAYRLLTRDSVEQKIRALQKQKAALFEDVLGEERFSQSLTLDDLRFLFAD